MLMGLVALAVALLAQKAVSQAPANGAIALVNVTVIPMDTERLLRGQTVLVQGGQVTAIGSVKQVKIPDGATRIDGQGKYLMPGLADMHAHLSIGQDVYKASAERLLFFFVANGVTTIRNMDAFGSGTAVGNVPTLQLRARAAAGELLSPRIYTSGPWSGQYASDQVPLDRVPAYVEAYKAAGYDFLKPYRESRAVFDAVVPVARRLGLPLAGHLIMDGSNPLSLESALAGKYYMSLEHLLGYVGVLAPPPPGYSPFMTPQPPGTWGPGVKVTPELLAAHRARFDWTKIPAIVAATKQAGVWNSPTLAAAEQLTLDSDQFQEGKRWPELQYVPAEVREQWAGRNEWMIGGLGLVRSQAGGMLEAERRIVKALQEAGAGLLLGTDAADPVPHLVPGFAVHRELEALVRAGLTPYQALLTGTKQVAEYFGTLDRTGTIAVGKRADLVLLGDNPLHEIRNSSKLAGVMVGGRWLSRAQIDEDLAGSPLSGIPTK